MRTQHTTLSPRATKENPSMKFMRTTLPLFLISLWVAAPSRAGLGLAGAPRPNIWGLVPRSEFECRSIFGKIVRIAGTGTSST